MISFCLTLGGDRGAAGPRGAIVEFFQNILGLESDLTSACRPVYLCKVDGDPRMADRITTTRIRKSTSERLKVEAARRRVPMYALLDSVLLPALARLERQSGDGGRATKPGEAAR